MCNRATRLIIFTAAAEALCASGFQISGAGILNLNNPAAPKFGLSPEGIRNPSRAEDVLKRLPDEDERTQLTSTKAGGDLLEHYNESLDLNVLERMAMACYGNLGVVFSSYYLEPLEVAVDLFEKIPADAGECIAEWDRAVSMTIKDDLFCTATCKVRVYDEDVYRGLTTEDISIGNLLRWKNLQPKFRLHEAGRSDHGGLWRFYSMDCPGKVEFDILEEFSQDALSFA